MEAVKQPTQAELMEWIKPVTDPELYVSIVELGLVYGIDFKQDSERIVIETQEDLSSCSL